MPYSKKHKERSREKIVASAARLFPRLGFDVVSIDMVMEDAGLTRGAFYAHFSNKAELYAESMRFAARQSPFQKIAREEMASAAWFEETIAQYLSQEHIDSAESPCPLAFLVTDINRRDGEVRATYTKLYANLVKAIEQRVKESGCSRDEVLAATAMMVGGAALAYALDDKRFSDRLLRASRDQCRELLLKEEAGIQD